MLIKSPTSPHVSRNHENRPKREKICPEIVIKFPVSSGRHWADQQSIEWFVCIVCWENSGSSRRNVMIWGWLLHSNANDHRDRPEVTKDVPSSFLDNPKSFRGKCSTRVDWKHVSKNWSNNSCPTSTIASMRPPDVQSSLGSLKRRQLLHKIGSLWLSLMGDPVGRLRLNEAISPIS